MGVPASMRTYQLPLKFSHTVFRTYDIRGAVEESGITPDLAYAIGRAIGAEAQACDQNTVIVGRDGRLSGPILMPALQAGLLESGCDVVDIGMVSSPVLYFATKHLPYRTGVMLTASHNPGNHNGFKTVLNGKTLCTHGVQRLKERIVQQDLPTKKPGTYHEQSVSIAYQHVIESGVKLVRPLKVVVDSGNGAAGPFAPAIYRALGCEVVSLYEEMDGRFPNHHPDPTIPANLVDIQKTVVENQADIGLAFDGDADRLGVVTNSGQVIWPDRQMMLFAQSVLAKNPGRPIVFDVKCSNQLAKVIEDNGGQPIMSRTGHSLLKQRMVDEDAPLAGEMSGHIFFNDGRWLGFDDGVYVGARLLEILAATDLTADALFAQFPCPACTPELILPIPEEQKESFMEALLQAPELQDAKRITIDGLRVEWDDGWGLVRPSNTAAYLTMRFEGIDQQVLDRIKERFRQVLLSIDEKIDLPF